jgi:hypothetical protein
MPTGPGKYDDACTAARIATGASAGKAPGSRSLKPLPAVIENFVGKLHSLIQLVFDKPQDQSKEYYI